MSEKVKICLGDLTYDTISLSTEAFPTDVFPNTSNLSSIIMEKTNFKK